MDKDMAIQALQSELGLTDDEPEVCPCCALDYLTARLDAVQGMLLELSLDVGLDGVPPHMQEDGKFMILDAMVHEMNSRIEEALVD